MSSIFSRAFLDYAAERAIKTAAQTAVASLAVGFTGILDVDWVGLGSVVGLATLTSVLTSVNSWTAPAAAIVTDAPSATVESATDVSAS
ncbi:holin [Gryllotalpicola koreensis]|uniref:Holin n=1 Tax=Gryllotalpicola koreensis TaxID=993086 RepID=A0ABP8A1N5_9MICO